MENKKILYTRIIDLPLKDLITAVGDYLKKSGRLFHGEMVDWDGFATQFWGKGRQVGNADLLILNVPVKIERAPDAPSPGTKIPLMEDGPKQVLELSDEVFFEDRLTIGRLSPVCPKCGGSKFEFKGVATVYCLVCGYSTDVEPGQ